MPFIGFNDRAGNFVGADMEHVSVEMETRLLAECQPGQRLALARAFLEMSARERRWLALATAEQHAISWGGYAWARWDGGEGGPLAMPPVTIYGALPTRRQFVAAERESHDRLKAIGYAHWLGPEQVITEMDAAYRRGWRYGNFFSQASPEGEHGEQHVVNLHPLTVAEFRRARRDGWPEDVATVLR